MSFRKKLLTAGLVLGSIAIPALADAYSPVKAGEENKGAYVFIGGGTTQLDDTGASETLSGTKYEIDFGLDSGFSYSAGVGYDFGKFRIEGSYNKANNDIDSFTAKAAGTGVTTTASGDVEISTWAFTGYYDFENESKWTPYVGAGIGTTKVAIEKLTIAGINTGDGDGDATTYQLKLGTSYEVAERTDLYGEVGYTIIEDLDIEGTDMDSTNSWGFQAGLRVRF